MKKIVKKYLIPNESNDYKPHLMRKAGLCVIASFAIVLFAIGIFEKTLFTQTDFLSSVLPPVLVDLANADRVQNAKSALKVNPVLTEVAQEKADDMASKGYFAHNTPDGKSPWYWFSKVGYSYSSAGENLAINFTDSGDVNTAWMNSAEHRANILNGKFTEIGVATAQGTYQGHPTVFVVQEFGKPYIVKNGAAFVRATPAKTSGLAASSSASTLATGPSATTTATTTVLGAAVTDNSPQVVNETQTFISTDAPDLALNAPAVQGADTKQASVIDRVATSPHKVFNIGYLILEGILILGLALMIGIEWKRQHPKNVLAGFVVLAIILILMYAYQQMGGTVVVL